MPDGWKQIRTRAQILEAALCLQGAVKSLEGVPGFDSVTAKVEASVSALAHEHEMIIAREAEIVQRSHSFGMSEL